MNTWKISVMLILYWPIRIKFMIRKHTSKLQTNYHYCLRLRYLAPYWLISRNTITFRCQFLHICSNDNDYFLQECAANVVRRFLVKELVVMQWINFSISNVSFVIYVVSNMSVLILVSHPLGSSISCQSSNLLVVQHVWSTLTVSVGCVCTMDYMLQIEFLSSCFVWLFWLSW